MSASYDNDIIRPLMSNNLPKWMYFTAESGMFGGRATHLGALIGFIISEDNPRAISKLVFVNCSSHYYEAELMSGAHGIVKVDRYYNNHIVGSDSAFMCSNLEFRDPKDIQAICHRNSIKLVTRRPFTVDDRSLMQDIKTAVLASASNSNRTKESIVFLIDKIPASRFSA